MNPKTYRLDFKKAFTLVELIVVIVILAILATIAFLSFSSQSAGARDSTRLADMSNIAKGLSVNYALAGKYPIPDSYISITASGAIASYQGKAGANILGMIRMSSGGKDPLDSVFYTYSINPSQSKFELLGFLEDGNNSALSLNPISVYDAFAADYSKRFTVTKGDQLGILLNSGTLDPVENQASASFTGVDIVNTTNSYAAIFGNKSTDKIVGTGGTIISGYLTYNDSSLIGYWNFNEGAGTNVSDVSGRGNHGTLSTFSGSNFPVFATGKNSTGLSFSGTGSGLGADGGYVQVGNKSNLSVSQGLTIASWVNVKQINVSENIIVNKESEYELGMFSDGFYKFAIANTTPGWAWISTNTSPTLNTWEFITLTYDSVKGEIRFYKNGVATYIGVGSGNILNVRSAGSNLADFRIGGRQFASKAPFNGIIDEVRVYNRALSNSEISAIYNASK